MAESRGKPERDLRTDRRIDRTERPGPPTPSDAVRTGEVHPAGPHAAPDLTDPSRTPGAGALPDPKAEDEIDAGTG
jgi:hypothetical protein